MSANTYNLWSLVLQAVIGGLMIATFVVYYRQLRAMRDGAAGQNILSLVQFLQAPHVREAREVVRRQLKRKPFGNWTDDDKRSASLVCSSYDLAAILIYQQRLVPAEPFVDNWGPSIIDCHQACGPYIQEMQKPENSGPSYWNDFERLAKAARR